VAVSRGAFVAVAAGLGLAACTTGPTAEEVRAMDLAACDAAGFETGSDAHGLCVLLQATNRRLEAVERRLNFIELDVRGAFSPLNRCFDRRC
jgi:hypothetical protein